MHTTKNRGFISSIPLKLTALNPAQSDVKSVRLDAVNQLCNMPNGPKGRTVASVHLGAGGGWQAMCGLLFLGRDLGHAACKNIDMLVLKE